MSHFARPTIRPLIFWEGFPPCGLLTRRLVLDYGADLKLLGTRGKVPFEELETLLGAEIEWLNTPDEVWDRRYDFADRNIIIHTGWNHTGWLKFDRWMKKRGAKIVVVVDNSCKWNPRQFLGAAWFRIWLRRHFDAAFVPGRSATRLMRFLGMPASRIFTGSYGASELVYKPGQTINERKREFIFVGQLIRRKGLDLLLEAFHLYRNKGGGWGLRIVGSGPMEPECRASGVIFDGFNQPQLTAKRIAEAKCLILPSREEHWGTVVCEALACGTPVIASCWVGAAEDLVRDGINGVVFNKMSPEAIANCMLAVSNWSSQEFYNAELECLIIASRYGTKNYTKAHYAIIDALF